MPSIWQRISESRLTALFVVITLLNCSMQVTLTGRIFYSNYTAGNALKTVYASQNMSYLEYTQYDFDKGVVKMCETNEQILNNTCKVVWPAPIALNLALPRLRSGFLAEPSPDTFAPKGSSLHSQKVISVHVNNGTLAKAGDSGTVHLSEMCLRVLKWPTQVLLQDKRDNLTLIVLQIWIFGLGFAALVNDSVPHLVAACIGYVSVATWSLVQLIDFYNFRTQYDRLIKGVGLPNSVNGNLGRVGACDGQDFLPKYFEQQNISYLLLTGWNFLGLVWFLYFTYRLYQSFRWTTFKRIGASILIERLYRMALMHLLFIQLAVFFLVAGIVLWVDQLFYGSFGSKAHLGGMYKALGIVALGVTIPWVILGSISVQRELRKSMLLFIFLTLLFILYWISQCFSLSWRLTFTHRPFFAAMQVASLVFIVTTFIIGILARIFCFGRGLPQYWHPIEESDSDDLHAAPDVVEGFEPVSFPSLAPLGDEEQGRHTRNASTSSGGSRVRGLRRADSDATLTNPHGGEDDWKSKKNELEPKAVDGPPPSATNAWNAERGDRKSVV